MNSRNHEIIESLINEKLRTDNEYKSTKTHWALLKISLNNCKIPVISPLFHNNRFVVYFKEKANLFNFLFAKQCSLLKNNSKRPSQLHLQVFIDSKICKYRHIKNNPEL